MFDFNVLDKTSDKSRIPDISMETEELTEIDCSLFQKYIQKDIDYTQGMYVYVLSLAGDFNSHLILDSNSDHNNLISPLLIVDSVSDLVITSVESYYFRR